MMCFPPLFLWALAVTTQGVAVKMRGVNDSQINVWLENIEPPSLKPNMPSENSHNKSCTAQKPSAWLPDQNGTYDTNAKLEVNSKPNADTIPRRLLKRNQIESFYCGRK